MTMPTTEEFLQSLYARRREIGALIQAAETRGDLREARAFQSQKKALNVIIQKKGGLPEPFDY